MENILVDLATMTGEGHGALRGFRRPSRQHHPTLVYVDRAGVYLKACGVYSGATPLPHTTTVGCGVVSPHRELSDVLTLHLLQGDVGGRESLLVCDPPPPDVFMCDAIPYQHYRKDSRREYDT